MPKDKNPGLPPEAKKVPIIGEFTEKDKKIIDTAVQAIVERVEPILNGIGQMVDGLKQRVEVLEEVKKIFPDKVEVQIMINDKLSKVLGNIFGRVGKLERPGK